MPDIQTLTSAVQSLETSASRWNKGALWLIAATAIVASLYFIVSWVASRKATALQKAQTALIQAKDSQLASDLRDKDETARRIEREAAQKIADTYKEAKRIETDANKQIEETKLDVAKQQERVAKAKKELLEIQERMKPRHLTLEQRTELLRLLRAGPAGPVAVWFTSSNPEARDFALELRAVLIEAGWAAWPFDINIPPSEELIIQVHIAQKIPSAIPAHAHTLRTALSQVLGRQVPAEILEPIAAPAGALPGTQEGGLVLAVGPKH